MNCSKFQLLFYLSNKEESLLHANCFYCEKVATQVFLNGLVLLIEGITFKQLGGIAITESYIFWNYYFVPKVGSTV